MKTQKKALVSGIIIGALLVAAGILLACSCQKLDPNKPGNLVAPTVTDDPSIPHLQLSDTRLHVQTFGNPDSTKIIVLEGGTGEDFRYLLRLDTMIDGWKLSDHYQLIFHDYRGCGLSQRHPIEELTMAASLQDLEELIAHFAPNEKVILIGHSHGGFVAGQYLNTHPEKVKGAVFIEPGAFSTQINAQLPAVNDVNYFGLDINQILWVKQMIGMNDHASADYMYQIGQINRNNNLRGETCPSLNYRAGAASAIAIAIGEVYTGNYDYTTNLGTFQAPVLFISSEESKDLGFDFQQKYQAILFPNYQHRLIEGTGHSGLINCRMKETLSYIRTYLEQF